MTRLIPFDRLFRPSRPVARGAALGAALTLACLLAAACGGASGTEDSDGADAPGLFEWVRHDADTAPGVETTTDCDGCGTEFDVPEVVDPPETVAEDVSGDSRPFLAPCDENAQCESGWCVPALNGKVCSKNCIEDCGEPGWSCEQNTATLPDVTFICFLRNAELCRPCDQHEDCQSPTAGTGNRCIDYGADGGFCGVACGDRITCPPGFSCVELRVDDEPTNQCVPDSGECLCTNAFRGLSTYCSVENQYGTCFGSITCEAAGFTPCTAPAPAYESCNNVDDDCDGDTDEVADLGSETCGLGACHHTVESCVAGVLQTCDPMQGAMPESCNGLDDDCDGLTDDNWPDKFGPCDAEDADDCERGRLVCSSDGSGLTCEGDQPETLEDCNAIDDDCDGETDEAEDLGATTCGLGICAHEVSLCVNGVWADCDPMEGAQATDDPDAGLVDSNCDGIDGDASKAIFVDKFNGNDQWPGTREQPLRTLQTAIDLAAQRGKPHVYVSTGTYTGPITLRDGVSIFGGYNAAEAWVRDPSNTATISGGPKAVIGFDINSPTILDTLSIAAAGNGQPGGSSFGVFLVRANGVRIVGCDISAGDGGNGQPGANGVNGSNGQSGARGVSGCEYDGCNILASCSSCSRPTGGPGGVRNCQGEDVSGGAGGNGGSSGSGGLAGSPGVGPAPGTAGTGGGEGRDGNPGGPGGFGSAGVDGSGGLAFGAASEAGYGASNGGNGGPGDPGSGGGGGGAGGGDSCDFFGGKWCKTYGTAGGGGGSGGCGGTGGFGGGGGGGSFGVFLWASSVTIEGGSIATARGGQGGAGGAGGLGGDGGEPGEGGALGDDDDQGLGAAGGRGGAGGDGGHGAGGGGGPSIGVLCGGGARPDFQQIDWHVGTPGAGGVSSGVSGAAGQSSNYVGCF